MAQVNPITLPKNVVRALLAYQQRKLHPWPSAWSQLDPEHGREGIALLSDSQEVLAEYWLAYGMTRPQLRVRSAQPAILIQLRERGVW